MLAGGTMTLLRIYWSAVGKLAVSRFQSFCASVKVLPKTVLFRWDRWRVSRGSHLWCLSECTRFLCCSSTLTRKRRMHSEPSFWINW